MLNEARLFPSKICKTITTSSGIQRPCPQLFYFPGISSKPWYDAKEFPFTKYLEENYKTIREEYQQKSQQIEKEAQEGFEVDPFHRTKEGVCLKFPFIRNGHYNQQFQKMMPKTNEILLELTKRGDGPMINVPLSSSYVSIMKPVTALNNHYGPSNIRLRVHLPLVLPDNDEACFIRVGGQVKFWKEGEVIVFDDTYEHESCNLSDIHDRALLIFDIWHPEITPQERHAIIEMFKHTKNI
eukprot:403353023